MGFLIVIVLTAFAIYCSEVYCDTLPTKVVKPEDTVPLGRNNSHDTMIEKEIFWRNLSLSKHKTTKLEPRNLDSAHSEADKRKGRFLNSLAFLTGLSFGGLASAASTMKTIAKMPQVFSINLGTSKTSPYLTAYYSQYPYAPLLPYPFFYPFGLTSMIDAVKPQTQNDLAPQIINLLDNRPIDLAENNEDYADEEKSSASNGADDRIRLRFEADRNTEEKNAIRGCKENQRKHVKETAREREYIQVNAADLRAALTRQNENQTGDNTTTTTTTTLPPGNNTNTTHHHHHHHHHHGHHHPHFPGYYGGYPQNIHHVDFTTTQPYSQINYNIPYEQPANFYQDDKYNTYPGFNPPFSAPFLPDQTNEYASTDPNRLYPLYQPPNITDGFRPLK